MIRSNEHVPRHCHHKATGQGYVRLNGKFHYTGVWGTEWSDRFYRRLVAEWLQNDRSVPEQPETNSGYWICDLVADDPSYAQGYYLIAQGSRSVNPITDLRPMCPACHAIVHWFVPILSTEEAQHLWSTEIAAAAPSD